MRASQSKRSPWLYFFLILALLVFLSLYMMPLLGLIGAGRGNSSSTTITPIQNVSSERQQELETEAQGFELVLQREPDNGNALRGLLDIRLKQGDIKGAIKPLERLANLNKEETGYTILLAQAKGQIKDYDGAIETYRQIIASQPGNMNALEGLVGLFLKQNRPQQAIGELQKIIKVAPQVNSTEGNSIDVTAVKLLLAKVYVKQERYQAAIAVYDQAIDANQQDWRPVLAKAMVLQEQGQESEANSLFNQAIEIAPVKYKSQIQQIINSSASDR